MPRKKSSPKKPTTKKVVDNTLEEYTESQITPGERNKMIAEAAYYRAKDRGFDPTSIEEDWYAAEKIVDEILLREYKEAEEH